MDVNGNIGFATVVRVAVKVVSYIGKQAYKKAFEWYSKILQKLASFTPAQQSKLNTIKEILHNIEVRKSLSGEILDAGHI